MKWKDNKWFTRKKYTKFDTLKTNKVTILQCQFHSGLTRIMVEESVFPPKHLRGLHDDSIRKLISHCRLSDSLKNNKKNQAIMPNFHAHRAKGAEQGVQQKHGLDSSELWFIWANSPRTDTLFLRYLDGLRMSAFRWEMWTNLVMPASLAAFAICWGMVTKTSSKP